mgnify:CR=1 FL=1
MQVVVRDNEIIAIHDDGQKITIGEGGMYSDATDLKIVPDDTEVLDEDENFVAWSSISGQEQTVESVDVARRSEYPDINDIVVALWEKVVEGRNDDETGVNSLQSIREAVKTSYPKT